jgi:HAD superfamily hydrolase (TIGR01509 family)
MPHDPVQLVCFDLGRVLVRICDDWRHACRLRGIAVPDDLPPMDAAAARLVKDASRLLDTGRIDEAEWARRVAPTRGLMPEQALAANAAFLLGPYDGAAELVDELNALGVQTACLSNTNDSHWRMTLDKSSPVYFPLDRLTHRFASHLCGLCKPDAAIFEHVERSAGVAPDLILFFDDLAENVDAARACGWRGHVIDTTREPVMQLREHLCAERVLL